MLKTQRKAASTAIWRWADTDVDARTTAACLLGRTLMQLFLDLKMSLGPSLRRLIKPLLLKTNLVGKLPCVSVQHVGGEAGQSRRTR